MRFLVWLLLCGSALLGCQRQVRTQTRHPCPTVTKEHSVDAVVKVVRQHFPKVALPHLGILYDYSVLKGAKALTISELHFFLPLAHIPPAKYMRSRIIPLLKELGIHSIDCLNIEMSRRIRRFVGYQSKLREIKVSFVCG